MQTVVVTSFSAAGYRDYGRRFIESFDRLFPADIPIIAYLEAPMVDTPARVQGRWLTALPAFTGFRQRWEGSALANGRQVTPAWKTRDQALGYSYRSDAMKFCRKVFAIEDAARRIGDTPTLLFWIDADVVAMREPVPNFLENMIGTADVAYLGRTGAHSECGFLGFRLPAAVALITEWAALYASDAWLNERESHDSFLFDRARERTPGLRYHDISPGGRGHVWHSTALGTCLDHLKGTRKALGYSPEKRG